MQTHRGFSLQLIMAQSVNNNTTNRLIKAKSPYLQQHANNPVDWHEWGQEAISLAKQNDKPILLSIGYAACHWCHVMAHQSFENDEIAQVMNDNFICIKLDREERPDLDAIYMDAVQAMGLNGGWPLNVFLTPDLKPFYGGTYFQPSRWVNLLEQISQAFSNHRQELEESAIQFEAAISRTESQKYGLVEGSSEILNFDGQRAACKSLKIQFDLKNGGLDRAPKFPLPSIWSYLLSNSFIFEDEEVRSHLLHTLYKMSHGGMYDTLGGGWARYSVDSEWFAPHFEKMLYDNAQLLSLYSKALMAFPGEVWIADIIQQTVAFLSREMLDSSGGFYSAIDADSEGHEGWYYTFSFDDCKAISAGLNFDAIADYFQITKEGNWESGRNILFGISEKSQSLQARLEEVSNRNGVPKGVLEKDISAFKSQALAFRSHRVRPSTDTKVISSWNGLLLSGLIEAYKATGNEQAKVLSVRLFHFIQQELIGANGELYHTWKDGDVYIGGFLDDYASVILGMADYHLVMGDVVSLETARKLNQKALELFASEEALFYYNVAQEDVIVRKKELFDNVIPSSNSMFAKALWTMGQLTGETAWIDKAKSMVGYVYKLLNTEVSYLTYWAELSLEILVGNRQCVGVGLKETQLQAFHNRFTPGMLKASYPEHSELPLAKNRTLDFPSYWLCKDYSCQLPSSEWEATLQSYIEDIKINIIS